MTTAGESVSTTCSRSFSTSQGISIFRGGGYGFTCTCTDEDHDAQENDLRLLRMEVKYQQVRIAQLELQRVVQQLRARIVQLERQLNSKHR